MLSAFETPLVPAVFGPTSDELLVAMADESATINSVFAASSASLLRALAPLMAEESFGEFVGALSLLTTFVEADIPVERTRELAWWFRLQAVAQTRLYAAVSVRPNMRCALLWGRLAECLRLAGREEATIFSMEARAIREYLGG